MTTPFEPKNELEEKLLAAQEGQLPPDEFMHYLLTAQLFMPVRERHQIGNFQSSDRAEPLLLEGEEGERIMVLFTSPERAKESPVELPPFQGGLLTELKWIFEKAGVGYGIALNPGYEIGLDLEADSVAQLAREGAGH